MAASLKHLALKWKPVHSVVLRSQRYAMVVENGTVTLLNVEKPQEFEVSNAETVLAAL